jgi:hypothetical protein
MGFSSLVLHMDKAIQQLPQKKTGAIPVQGPRTGVGMGHISKSQRQILRNYKNSGMGSLDSE